MENKKEFTAVNKNFLVEMLSRLERWSQADFHIQNFVVGSSLIEELICFIDIEAKKTDTVLANKSATNLKADLLIISGFINYKKMKKIQEEYKKLGGFKYVVTLGNMVNNIYQFESYNRPGDINKFIPVDLHIHGSPPTIKDILSGINQLKDIRVESI